MISFLLWAILATHIHPEAFYQQQWCDEHKGVMEYVLDDRSRVDCLTDEYAVEVEFAAKWKESIGQALFYGVKTGKKPGVVLIMEKGSDGRFLDRLNAVADEYEIKVWVVRP